MKYLRALSVFLTTAILMFLMSCNAEGEMSSKGTANVKVTDAAVDFENVTGVFLSVSEVRLSQGNEIEVVETFDEPVTFDVMAYQNGEAFELGEGEVDAGSYNGIRLILTDDSYILFEDGTTESLNVPSGTSSGYKIQGEFDIQALAYEDIVVDIDLRKALVMTGEGTYKLRPTARLIVENTTSTINGTITSQYDESKTIVAYAYAKGTYEESETNAPVEGETRFENSINSAVVAENGTFTLAYMPEGEYDIIVASYENMDEDEDLEFVGTFETSLTVSGNILDFLTIESSTDVNLIVELL